VTEESRGTSGHRWDRTQALLHDGYRFITDRCERFGTDVFETRLLLEPTICLRGEAGARLFYDTARVTRRAPCRGE
jgi:fatty-acid peroxygenase